MDVGRLEEQVAARTVRAEARARRKERRETAKRQAERAKRVAEAREVHTGEDADGHWLSFPADTDPSDMRVLLVVSAVVLASLAVLPLFVWWSLWTLPVWLVLSGGASFWAGLRYGLERPAKLVVTPRGYWAFLDGETLRGSGRIEDLRIVLGGYREESAAYGMKWVALYGPDGKLCESEQLQVGGAARVRRFGKEVGATVSVLR